MQKSAPAPKSASVQEHALGRLPRARRGSGPHPLPSPEAVRALPPFERLPDASIVMVGPELAQQAADEIGALSVVGFDTESKPVFVRGQAQDGPHRCSLPRQSARGCSRCRIRPVPGRWPGCWRGLSC
ncbi:hypothetical protein V8H18_03850 [Lautropia mirabilis]